MKYNRYPKRDSIKNYFPLPNEIFCLWLTGGEILVYTYIMFCENRKTFQCYPSYRSIGNAIGKSRNTVRKYNITTDKEKRLFDRRRSFVKADQMNIGGKTFQVYSIFDHASNQTAADKIKYLIDSDAKN